MNILLIRLRLIGDVVFTTPAIRAIKRELPTARLTYLVEPPAAPILANNPHLDRLLTVGRSRGLARLGDDLAMARLLRQARFDVVLDFHGGPHSAWLARTTGAPIRIGYDMPGRQWVYTHLVGRPRELRPRHSVENQWDLLRPLGASFEARPDPARDAVEMIEDRSAAASVRHRLATAGVGSGHRLIVAHISAGNRFRQWPHGAFSDLLAALLAADSRRRAVVIAGPSDPGAAVQVRETVRTRLGPAGAHAVLADHEFNLAELRSLIGSAALFIGGDSGPLHVAATTGTPIVGLYGPTLTARSAPWRDPSFVTESVDVGELPCRPCEQRHCIPGDFRCLTGLSAELVRTAAERALERAAAASRTASPGRLTLQPSRPDR